MLTFAKDLTRLGVRLVKQTNAKLRNAIVCPGFAQFDGKPGYADAVDLLGKAAAQPACHQGFGEGRTFVGNLRM